MKYRIEEPIPAQPFIDWLDRKAEQLAVDHDLDGYLVIAERAQVYSPDALSDSWLRKGAFRHAGVIERRFVEVFLDAWDVAFWELYPDLDDTPSPIERKVDSRGRDLTKRRGKTPKLSDDQIVAAWRLHTEGGISLRELGRRGYKAWGYSSAVTASNQLSKYFQRLELPARDRMEATVKVSTKHGLLPRDPAKRDRDYVRQQRVARGEIRDVQCAAIKTRYGKGRGERCQRPALRDSDYCRAHDERFRAEREQHLDRMRSAQDPVPGRRMNLPTINLTV